MADLDKAEDPKAYDEAKAALEESIKKLEETYGGTHIERAIAEIYQQKGLENAADAWDEEFADSSDRGRSIDEDGGLMDSNDEPGEGSGNPNDDSGFNKGP